MTRAVRILPGRSTLRRTRRASRTVCRRHSCAPRRLDSPAGQYNFLQGGNQTLQPETSDTYTYGVVFQPRFLPHLAMSIDYFDIDIQDTISTFGSENTLGACYLGGDAAACSRVHRDSLGNLWRGDGFVEDLNINIGSLSTKGWDLSLTYSGVELGGLGELSFNLTGTLLDELITEPGPGVAPVECAGKFSGSTLRNPESGMAASLPRRLGDTLERGPCAHLALLRQRDEHRPGHGGQHRLRAGRA